MKQVTIVVATLVTCLAGASRASADTSSPIHTDLVIPHFANTHSSVASTHTIFMNPCTSGCQVTPGNDDSRTNTSSIVQSSGNLSAFPYSATAWSQVMTCVKATFAPFNVTITDVDPNNASHFEIMVGGSPQNLGFDPQSGGVAPFGCDAQIDNALVFDFAGIWGQGSSCGALCVNNICATAAQEIAHTWALDHVTDPVDAMTYNGQNSTTPRTYQNRADQCGSDCVGGQGPLPGETCSGQNHACFCTGQQTQNSYQTVLALFGPAGAIAPTVAITSPANGATVSTGFKVDATCDSGDSITSVDLLLDDAVIATLTHAPYSFTTPGSVASGSHKISIACTTSKQAQATANANVTVGSGCSAAAPCAVSTDVCLNGACVAGMDAPGGLGHACGGNSDCTSTMCASDGSQQVCVIGCDPMASGQCPSGFTCVTAGASGVCFPGSDGGGGGCLDVAGTTTTAGGRGPIFLLLGGIVAVIIRRRKPA